MSVGISRSPQGQPEPQHQTQEKDVLSQNMTDMLVRRIDPLCRTSAHRVTAEQLCRDWGIVVQSLDLRTGGAADGEVFIQPIPPTQIQTWLDEFRPWDQPGAGQWDFDLPGSYDPHEDRHYGMSNSLGISRMVCNYIEMCYRYEKGSIIRNKTRWRPSSFGVKHLSSSTSNIHRWHARFMLHQCEPADAGKFYLSETRPDSALPHLGCFLHDDELLADDGSLSTAELTTIMVLALRQAMNPIYKQATVVPITVYSCAGQQVRIIQGCIDFRHRQFDIRYSEILDFNEGGVRRTEENMQRFLTLLGWVLGNPVGNVKRP
ncbi:kinase-like domain [Cordyceps militaris]|uniref:Kinase-like domain n=1 Tax=Cordyceps militaris TaxID=73501 RepID=A0A2H4SRQ7_CORMI|nr:kinase-like domain [Cordyceps militaris]